MNILQSILAPACFGIGFLIAGTGLFSSPAATVLVIVAVIGISVIVRRMGSKKNK